MSLLHQVVRLGVELGLAVSDYNSHVVHDYSEIIRVTMLYLAKVKEAVHEGLVSEEELPEYFALVGQSWGSVINR
jgi:hypothetical protein